MQAAPQQHFPALATGEAVKGEEGWAGEALEVPGSAAVGLAAAVEVGSAAGSEALCPEGTTDKTNTWGVSLSWALLENPV